MPSLSRSRYLATFLTTFGLIAYGFLAIGLYKNPNSVEKYFHFDPIWLMTAFIFFNLICRFKFHLLLPRLAQYLNQVVILPLSGLGCITLTIVDYLTPPNYVFDHLLINYQQLGLIAISSLIIALVNAPSNWYKAYYRQIIFWSGVVFLLIMFLIRLWPNDVFLQLVKEDHLIENSQFFALLVSSLLSFYIAVKNYGQRKILFAIYLLVGIGLFVVAGEEISWGQRLLMLNTPTYFAKNNLQDETNLHNLSIFSVFIGYIYVLVGVYGSFFWLIAKKLTRYPWLSWITPREYLFVYFFSGGFYNFCVIFLSILNHGEWSEVAELMLDLGVLFFVIGISWRTRRLYRA